MPLRSAPSLMLLVALAGAHVLGCNAVLGLDERELAPDAELADSTVEGDDGVVVDAVDAGDSTTVEDISFHPDTRGTDTRGTDVPVVIDSPTDTPTDTPVDAPVSATCASLGLHCAAGQSCIVSLTTSRTYGFGCEPSPATGTRGLACLFDGKTYKCQEGLACNYAYPTGYVCVPLCTGDAECVGSPSGYPWCGGIDWIAPPPTPKLARCNSCDPVVGGVSSEPCTGGMACLITSSVLPPSCRPATGSVGVGGSCGAFVTKCAPGLVCDCTTDLGAAGCDTKGGTCKKVCHSTADCGVAGGTCTPFKAGSSYSLCGP